MKIELERPLMIESVELSLVSPRRLSFTGSLLTNSAQEQVERVLQEVHTYIVAAKLGAFTVDVRLLNFVNSSALRLFITWISRAEQARYKLVFVTDPGLTWHRLNFSVLKSLAPQSVEIAANQEAGG